MVEVKKSKFNGYLYNKSKRYLEDKKSKGLVNGLKWEDEGKCQK